jgi:hypothetical protein
MTCDLGGGELTPAQAEEARESAQARVLYCWDPLHADPSNRPMLRIHILPKVKFSLPVGRGRFNRFFSFTRTQFSPHEVPGKLRVY